MLAQHLRHPGLERWLPLLVLPPVLVVAALLSDEVDGIDLVGVLAAYLGCLPLVVRRDWAFGLLVPFLVAGISLVLWQVAPTAAVVCIPAWALFDLGRLRPTRTAVVAAAVVPFGVVASCLPTAESAADIFTIAVSNTAICELALAAGLLWRRTQEANRGAVAAAEADAARAASEERLRIAREVHDVVAHSMVAISVQSGVALHRLGRDPAQAEAALRDIRRTSGEALADLRATLGALSGADAPAPVAPGGLGDLEPLVDRLRAADVDVSLDVAPLPQVPAAIGAVGYRVVQEALTNVLRHAHASRASVRVDGTAGRLSIDVRDDGPSAPADEARAVPAGSQAGLRGMRERAKAVGGTLEAGPLPAGGWHVHASLPLPRA